VRIGFFFLSLYIYQFIHVYFLGRNFRQLKNDYEIYSQVVKTKIDNNFHSLNLKVKFRNSKINFTENATVYTVNYLENIENTESLQMLMHLIF